MSTPSYIVVTVPKPRATFTGWLLEWTAVGPFTTREGARLAAVDRNRKLGPESEWIARVVPIEGGAA